MSPGGETAAHGSPPAGAPEPAGILLAAGGSSRFGAQKLLQPLGGVPLVRIAAERVLAGGVASLAVVLGREATSVRAALEGLPLRLVLNHRYAAGLAGSIRAGIRALPPDAGGALVALGDQPGVRADVVGALLLAFRRGAGPIVAPEYAGVRGHPVLFARDVFPDLLRLRGDEGARSLLAAHPERVHLVPFDFPSPPDVDTPADYEQLAALDTGGPQAHSPR